MTFFRNWGTALRKLEMLDAVVIAAIGVRRHRQHATLRPRLDMREPVPIASGRFVRGAPMKLFDGALLQRWHLWPHVRSTCRPTVNGS